VKVRPAGAGVGPRSSSAGRGGGEAPGNTVGREIVESPLPAELQRVLDGLE